MASNTDPNYRQIFEEIAGELSRIEDKGKVADYIPELSCIDPKKLGIHLRTTAGQDFSFGDSHEAFSIQSIAKVLSLTLAFRLVGNGLWKRVGIEPSGSAFNSLVQLEHEQGKPRNPFINAGAIVVCDVLLSELKNPRQELLSFIQSLSPNADVRFCQRTVESEQKTGFRNYALAYLMKDFGNLDNDVEAVLTLYFNLCSIEMSCAELAETFSFLANNGVNSEGEVIICRSESKRINAIMQTCGFYDEAGEFAFGTGLPGKSGVGGGIIATHPGQYSVAVWSPKLNTKGNSYKGMKVLEAITTKTESSIF